MTTRVQRRSVRLTAAAPVEIEPGIILPAGIYEGVEKRLGVPLMAGMSWTPPEYHLELSEVQLVAMGAKPTPNMISTEYDLSKFVRLGQITVS